MEKSISNVDINSKTYEGIETKIDNDNIPKKSRLNSFRSKHKSFWLKLLIDDKNELNTFKIKENKKIFVFTNIYITSIYLIPLLALIATITINFINLDYYIDMIVTVTLISVAGLAFFLSLFIGGVLVKITSILSGVSFSNAFYLVHSKYLIDKFAHFYNIDLNHIINNYLGKLNEFELISSKYLKTKDKSQLTINENPKNRGIIFRVYSKNKSKAIKLMELNIKYFFHITQWASIYVLILIFIPIIVAGFLL